MAYKTLVAASYQTTDTLHTVSWQELWLSNHQKCRAAHTNGELSWTDAMLYPVLHRMESDGLIQSEWVVLESGRKRKYYTITAKGKTEREETKAQWLNVNHALNLLWNGGPQLELG